MTSALLCGSDLTPVSPNTDELPPASDKTNPPRVLSFYEFWPMWAFYTPLKLYALFLALRYRGLTLPSLTNPLFDMGGFVGESKTQIMDQIPSSLAHLVAAYIRVENKDPFDAASVMRRMHEQSISFPCVAKPDIGCRGMGVQRLFCQEDLIAYAREFPKGEAFMIQELCDYPHEVGVFYIRHPDWKQGLIFSLTEKRFASVVGDGVSSLGQLIANDPRAGRIKHIYLERHKNRLHEIIPAGYRFRIAFAGSHSRGTIFKNANHLISPALNEAWDAVCQQIPEFYFGRFDVRFNSWDDFKQAESIKILEINGAGAEATHIWDANTPLSTAYKTLARQYKHMFEIGRKNKNRGFIPSTIKDMRARIKKQDALAKRYPMTH